AARGRCHARGNGRLAVEVGADLAGDLLRRHEHHAVGVAWHLYGLAAEGLLHLPDGVTGDGRIIREPYVQGLGLQLLTVDWRTRVRQWPARAHPARAEIALDRGDRITAGELVDEQLRQHLGLRRRGL